MEEKSNHKIEPICMTAASLILFVIVSVVAGCSVPSFGYLKQSREITVAFRANSVFENYKYYYRGWYSRPYAIAGVRYNFKLKPNTWKEIDLSDTRFDKLIDRMEIRYGYALHGAKILGPGGKQIGVWYSSLERALVKVEKESRIIFLSPEVRQITGP